MELSQNLTIDSVVRNGIHRWLEVLLRHQVGNAKVLAATVKRMAALVSPYPNAKVSAFPGPRATTRLK